MLPNAEPRLTKEPVTIGGYDYPAGVALLASAFLVHHDPDIYPEPYAFRPERFVGNPPGTYTWLPFGGGRRRCLGASFALQEMKIVIRAVLSRFEIAPVDPRRRRPPGGASPSARAVAPRSCCASAVGTPAPASAGRAELAAAALTPVAPAKPDPRDGRSVSTVDLLAPAKSSTAANSGAACSGSRSR